MQGAKRQSQIGVSCISSYRGGLGSKFFRLHRELKKKAPNSMVARELDQIANTMK